MVDFDKAYAITMKIEGGYANDKDDNGGMTWAGIAYNYSKNWGGWKIINSIINALKVKSIANINLALRSNSQLASMVKQFYLTNYWNINSLGNLNDQQLANSLYDIGVNMGTGKAAEFLQLACNDVIASEKINIARLVVDRQVGSKTIVTANELPVKPLYDTINNLRKQRYLDIIANNPSQAKFKNSWMSRIKPYVG